MRLHRVVIYREDSTARVEYQDVKHWFWTADNTVLVVAIVSDHKTGEHYYVHWLRERICWFKTYEQEKP